MSCAGAHGPPEHLDLVELERALKRHPTRVVDPDVGRVFRAVHEANGARRRGGFRALSALRQQGGTSDEAGDTARGPGEDDAL